MKSLFTQLILSGCMLLTGRCLAQSHWPKTIYNPGGGSIKIYKPQVESFTGSILKSKTTIALLAYGDDDPIFGVAWTTDTVKTDRDKREVTIQSVRVDNLRIAADNAPFTEADVRKALEVCIPSLIRRLPLDGVLASLDQSDEDTKLAGDIGNKPPKLIFRTSPSILVPIDGQPILRENKEWGLDVVVNSPATIIKDKDGQFYLYAGGNWYVAPAATGPYGYKDKVGRPLKEIGRGLEKAAKKNGGPAAGGPAGGGVAEGGPGGPAGGSGGSVGSGGPAAGVKGRAPAYDIVVSTVPAELIQTDGSPDMQPAAATALRYAANSGDAILMDTTTKQYYVLLSGRWYRSDSLTENGQWQYVAADRLPKDFARIPESSPIADVLPSVAGTPEAKDAVMDAQVPQLEKIDRRTATTEVVYDGEPEFQSIEGTDMMYAMNTCSTVLSWQDRYYAVDDGVWFTAGSPLGPWTASTVRPAEMDLLPPDCPVYNARYADVYHVSNNYVYDGYTPGYLNSYIDNCTVVYGTGFYYSPWRGNFYYPRPWTWGFGMCYDPWYGWGFGMDYDDDLFDCGWGWDAGFGFVWGGGYGGGSRGLPGIYHPAYPVGKPGRHGRYDRHGGYVVINRGQSGPQGQGQRLVNGRAAAVPAGTVAGTGTTGTRTVARPGYGGSRTGGYAGMRGGGGGYGGRGSNGGGYAGGRSVGASGGGYAGGRSGGGYSGGGSRGGGYSGGGASGGGGNSGGGGGHVGSSGGGGASGGGGGGGHVSSGGGGGSSSGGGGGGHH